MDIGKVVIYEHIYELVVTLPNSEFKTGLVMGVRSASSEQCKAILRKHTNEQTNQFRSKQKRITAELLEQNELEATAASIAWWKWGVDDDGNDANYDGGKPELNMTLAIKILGEVNWLYAQVKEAGSNLENFMPKSVTESVPTSSSSSNMIALKTKTTEPVVSETKPLAKAI